MASETPSPSSPKLVYLIRGTHAPHDIQKKLHQKKHNSADQIIARARCVVVEKEDYSNTTCEHCGSGDNPEELMLCEKCDNGFHMKCVRPIVVRIPIGSWICPNCSCTKKETKFTKKKILDFFGIGMVDFRMNVSSPHEAKRHRRRSKPLVLQKKRRRLLPFVPTTDLSRRLTQMASLASALTSLNIEFCNHLTYFSGMAPRSANQSSLENGGMQTLTKEDGEIIEHCTTMIKRGEFPPLMVVYDSCQGYTLEADDPIKDMTFIAEYTGDVDYLKKREFDDCDSMMTLLLAEECASSLVICADKRANIARFISGINNHTP
ncbi:hypothetical protein TSUD_318920 [Trifolium subterraneum]|uniref:PHD-type domain-containing protein n=1 Tax=Trifolium subterraneum TaxID=3900 RepID=A0A2Z6MZR9_TRISU|nr:hypothetical protein TSUD_318920 [Trifolium subterraneum]